jgi:hypothetical protein
MWPENNDGRVQGEAEASIETQSRIQRSGGMRSPNRVGDEAPATSAATAIQTTYMEENS